VPIKSNLWITIKSVYSDWYMHNFHVISFSRF
jgi:hypothetical protein